MEEIIGLLLFELWRSKSVYGKVLTVCKYKFVFGSSVWRNSIESRCCCL